MTEDCVYIQLDSESRQFKHTLDVQELEEAEYDAKNFYSADGEYFDIYILTSLEQISDSQALFQDRNNLRNYVIKSEKVLYYCLATCKELASIKLNEASHFYFADAADFLLMHTIHRFASLPHPIPVIVNSGHAMKLIVTGGPEARMIDLSSLAYVKKNEGGSKLIEGG